ncbi:MAG TPA: hypothetical protein VM686_41700 [Polyangiaceae bacterium]|nr:hypothetical protein [Polyangiaceae bacterium]
MAVLCAAPAARAAPQACITENNQGAEARAAHQLLAAREHYLACAAAAECPAMVRDECNAALAELKSSLPTLIVAVVDDGKRDLSDASLTLDGKAVLNTGSAIEVDPGPHTLVASRGYLRAELEIVARENEVNRRVELVLAGPAEAEPKRTPLSVETTPAEGPSRVPSYVLAGVAALGAGSFTYFALSGRSGESDLEKCKPHCTANAVEDVRTRYLIADVSLGVSIVALGAAAYLWLSAEPEKPAESATITLDLGASPSGVGLSVRSRL